MSADWTQAGCLGDPDAMFTDRPAEIAYNRRVCAACPIRADCLNYAIEMGEAYGMWGGHTPEERRAMLIGRTDRIRPHLVAQVIDGVQPFRVLNRTERAHLWRQHAATGLPAGQFARRYRLSGTTLKAVRAAADQHQSAHDLAA